MAEINGVMMQYFHWYIPSNGQLWTETEARSLELAKSGFTALWLPPAYKGIGGGNDVGYGVYDLYDLGEFDQKGSIRTKYGTRDQYLSALQTLQRNNIQVYVDVVLNHRMGGDAVEVAKATPFPKNNRLQPKGNLQEIKTYSHFKFPGRRGQYSQFEWHWWHFDGVDYNEFNPNDHDTVYLFEGKKFDDFVDLEKGNFAYLMGCDVDFQDASVREEITRWGKWYLDTTKADGFRLDAIKHISSWFFPQWLTELEKYAGRELFVVGEYWTPEITTLHWYLDNVGNHMSVFDVSLHYNFHYASRSKGQYDMRRILDNTLMQQRPGRAVTFVENHDSQPLQALESVVEAWFKPLAYAIILLRREGYPCVFYADYYGATYEDKGRDGNTYKVTLPSHQWLIDKLLFARRNYAYGPQYDYFDHWNTIGWTRLGRDSQSPAMAVLMSDGPEGNKWMEVARPNARFIDITNHVNEPVYTNESGWGQFRCRGGSVSVWVQQV